MQEIYEVLPSARGAYELNASRLLSLPGVLCPNCGAWGGSGVAFPTVTASSLKNVAALKSRWPIPQDQFQELRASLAPVCGDHPGYLQWNPGTEFGELVGSGFGKPQDFCFCFCAVLLVESAAFAALGAHFNLRGRAAKIRWRRKNAPVHIELEIPAVLEFDCDVTFDTCKICGRRAVKIPDDIRPVSEGNLPGEIWRGKDCTTRIACSQRFKQCVEELGLSGIVFRKFGSGDIQLPMPPVSVESARRAALPHASSPQPTETAYGDFDFAGWVAGVKSQGVIVKAPHSGPLYFERPHPAVLQAFFERGSAGLQVPLTIEDEEDREYLDPDDTQNEACELMDFCSIDDIPTLIDCCQQWADPDFVAADLSDCDWWTHAFPILGMRNGDYLALDHAQNSQNPPVVYLNHEGPSYKISRSFTEFLTEWSRLGFPGPECWLLEPFLDEEGMLNSKMAGPES